MGPVSKCMDISIVSSVAIKSKHAAARGQKKKAAAEWINFIVFNRVQ